MMLCLAVGLLLAADPPKPEKPPVIPIELQADYFASSAQAATLKPTWDATNVELQQGATALQKACGDKFHPEVQGKRIACVANKPEAK